MCYCCKTGCAVAIASDDGLGRASRVPLFFCLQDLQGVTWVRNCWKSGCAVAIGARFARGIVLLIARLARNHLGEQLLQDRLCCGHCLPQWAGARFARPIVLLLARLARSHLGEQLLQDRLCCGHWGALRAPHCSFDCKTCKESLG